MTPAITVFYLSVCSHPMSLEAWLGYCIKGKSNSIVSDKREREKYAVHNLPIMSPHSYINQTGNTPVKNTQPYNMAIHGKQSFFSGMVNNAPFLYDTYNSKCFTQIN